MLRLISLVVWSMEQQLKSQSVVSAGKLSISHDEIITAISKLENKVSQLDTNGKWR